MAIPTYDPAGANRLLDEMGLDKKDRDGFRLGPNGERFEIFIEHTTWYPEMKVMPEAIEPMLEKVGIAVRTQIREGGLFWERHNSNQLYAGNLWFHHGIWPYHWYEDFLGIRWAQQWFNWSKSGGMEGEEPPPEYKEIWELHRQMKTSQDYAERDRLWAEIKNKLSENLFWIPIVEFAEKPAIVSKKLGNTVVSGYTNFNNYHLELVYWKDSGRFPVPGPRSELDTGLGPSGFSEDEASWSPSFGWRRRRRQISPPFTRMATSPIPTSLPMRAARG